MSPSKTRIAWAPHLNPCRREWTPGPEFSPWTGENARLDNPLLAIGPACRYASKTEGPYVEGPVIAVKDEFRQGQAARRRVHDAVARLTAGHIDVFEAALPAADDGGKIERVAGVVADPAAPQFEGL